MIRNKSFIRSSSLDPYHNQALEACLLDDVREGEIILYLWQNQRTVVIGKNQDAYAQCDIEALEKDGGTLARRTSGGGAVYHDTGNLNFTFLSSLEDQDIPREEEVILSALRKLGIEAYKSGRNDLLYEGKKFSGHAYYRKKDRAYHHGTLMINVRRKDLEKYLHVSKRKLADKRVDSVRSRVVNLHEIDEDLTTETLAEALISSFDEIFPGTLSKRREEDLDNELLRINIRKFSDPSWRYGERINRQYTKEERFSWGMVTLSYDVKDGKISGIELYTDALFTDALEGIVKKWEGMTVEEILTGTPDTPEETDLKSIFMKEAL